MSRSIGNQDCRTFGAQRRGTFVGLIALAFLTACGAGVDGVEPQRGAQAPSPSGVVGRAGRMAFPRACHSATPLPDGKVLIAGGCTGDSCETGEESGTAELFDPPRRTFRTTSRMTTPRAGHTATSLRDGRVLLAGGWGMSGTLASAEIYDPANGRFTATGRMAAPRGGHTATALKDGRVLILGGETGGGRLAAAEIYDPSRREFAEAGGLGAPRSEHTATLLSDGRVLVVGGSRSRAEVLASAEIFDPVSRTSTPVGDMRVPRRKHAAVALEAGRVMVLGGSSERDASGRYSSTEIFAPATRRFLPGPDMGAERFKITGAALLLGNGSVLVAGGDETVEVYDPGRKAFRPAAGGVGAEYAFATATRLPGGDVLIAGGYDSRIHLTAEVWIYHAGPEEPEIPPLAPPAGK